MTLQINTYVAPACQECLDLVKPVYPRNLLYNRVELAMSGPVVLLPALTGCLSGETSIHELRAQRVTG